ncbi:MAG: hypothetical protein UZ20_WS6002000443 [candidate division WS6 bacterium OLB21]|uniref:Uncharacterized protein n=1 Tax=candidate division WS6 bacterium OLB21 TaxID=1617427 RepID=A0A136KJQ4_9BACT|nr:MAG: hypothetical protein UZ20_WS6002000443 [candidate division WS6 bacterium OLB21]
MNHTNSQKDWYLNMPDMQTIKSQLANRDSATKVIDKVKNANWIIDSIVSKNKKVA